MARKRRKGSPWLWTREAAAQLGLSPKTLRSKLPRLRRGFHYRVLDGVRPTYQWHGDRCEKALFPDDPGR